MSKFKSFLLEKRNPNQDIIDALPIGRHNHRIQEFKSTNPKQFKMGMDVEMEHVPDGTPPDVAYEIAARITADHLAENSNYYTLLETGVESQNDGEEDKWEKK